MTTQALESMRPALGGKIECRRTLKEHVAPAHSGTNGQPHLPNPGKTHIMARADAKTAVLADGLRYKSKVSGSPFAATTSFGAATMSCFMCGKHRARSLMGTRKVLGKSQAVCAPSCKELDAILAAQAAGNKV